jgi:zinc/manganese transport system permease protein
VVSAALLILVLSRSGEGDEHIKEALVGNILLVNKGELLRLSVIYTILGAIHFFCRKYFFMISRDPKAAFAKGLNVRGWDFLFYLTFGVVVTNSVRIAGVLLVFSYLVVPSVCAMFVANSLKNRLLVGWLIGLLASILGMAFSYYLDFPTGASVVCMLGFLLVVVVILKKLLRFF